MFNSKKVQAAVIAFFFICFLFIARAITVGVCHIRMSDAIYVYQLDCRRHNQTPLVFQSDKETFEDTYRRWWDWSDHHILDKYADIRVRPYLGEDVETCERTFNYD